MLWPDVTSVDAPPPDRARLWPSASRSWPTPPVPDPHRPRALVLAPTRELADQIMTELRSLSGKVRVAVVYGGVGYGNQMTSLRRGVDILVACPGRLEDLIEKGAVHLSAVDAVVIDEADRMADMGFIPACAAPARPQAAPDRQTMLFSATLDGDAASLTRDYQHNPVYCEVGDETPDVIAADHLFWRVTTAERTEVAIDAISAAGPSIVFCKDPPRMQPIGPADWTGPGSRSPRSTVGRSQNQRTRALQAFATGRVRALTATDVAARGIHIEGVGSGHPLRRSRRPQDLPPPLGPHGTSRPATVWWSRSCSPTRSKNGAECNVGSASDNLSPAST